MNKCAVILAGGEGKRMGSEKPKTLCEVLGKPMLRWVIDAVKDAGIDDICIVKGYRAEYIDEYVETLPFSVKTVLQAERLGTGHAVMMARAFLEERGGSVVILGGDAPFVDADTIRDSLSQHIKTNSSATVISASVSDSTGYGRIVRNDDNSLKAIVEHKDADDEIKKIKEINSGAYWFETEDLLSVLDSITADNNAKEYYLPDALKLIIAKGKKAGAFVAKSADVALGANDPAQLEELNQIAIEKGYAKAE
ncbi:MAG: NTP transferase domain-containing protein [Ruminococcus sp.]|nr:NTP transferase domain-containing protein [Ruminococcus sp.]MBQ2944159.1 NTP transferase domain-containing protein [Ruminococcus sp.]